MTTTLTKPLPIHPYCEMFPPMSEEDRANLKASIKTKGGLDDPIIEYDRHVLDGRHRQELCIELGIEPVYKLFQFPRNCQNKDAELLRFVKSRNLDRRHLTISQLAMMAATLLSIQRGQTTAERQPNVQHCTSQSQAAEELGVSLRSVAAASKVLAGGDNSLIQAVRQGTVSAHDAVKIVDRPKPEQAQAVMAVASGNARTVAEAAKCKPKDAQANLARLKQIHSNLTTAISRAELVAKSLVKQIGQHSFVSALHEMSEVNGRLWQLRQDWESKGIGGE